MGLHFRIDRLTLIGVPQVHGHQFKVAKGTRPFNDAPMPSSKMRNGMNGPPRG
jgi:hypothetical protein